MKTSISLAQTYEGNVILRVQKRKQVLTTLLTSYEAQHLSNRLQSFAKSQQVSEVVIKGE